MLLPGASIFSSLSALSRCAVGFIYGVMLVPVFPVLVAIVAREKRAPLTILRISTLALIVPLVILTISISPMRDLLFSRYLSKIAILILAGLAFLATSNTRSALRSYGTRLLSSDIVFATLLYVIGDAILWLTMIELHEVSTPLLNVARNALFVSGLQVAIVGITGRRSVGHYLFLITAAVCYFATYLKMLIMHAPLMPMDIQYLRELQLVAPDFISGTSIVVFLAAVGLVFHTGMRVFRASKTMGNWSRSGRLIVGMLLLSTGLLPLSGSAEDSARWSPLWKWCHQGTWLNLVSNIHTALAPVPPPRDYSRDRVAKLISSIEANLQRPEMSRSVEKVCIVMVLVESLIDLQDLGVNVTPDPQPFLHETRAALGSQWAIVAEACSGSSITEFELLTGMEARMWGPRTIPYYCLGQANLDSVPRRLERCGYETHVLQIDPEFMYNRPDAYRRLGIQNAEWLSKPFFETHDSPTGNRGEVFGSELDQVLFDRIHHLIDQSQKPSFVFAFTGGTHAPYHSDTKKWSIQSNQGEVDLAEISGYCDEVNVLDRRLRTLWESLQNSEQKVILLVVGDHMPPFRSRPGPYLSANPVALKRVPLMVLGLDSAAFQRQEISTNMIPWALMRSVGIEFRSAFELSALGALDDCGVVSGNSSSCDSVHVRKYRQIQFGLLIDGLQNLPNGGTAR